jgi:hypothetical protein
MSIFKNFTQFYINTNILLFQNQLFLNNVNFTATKTKTRILRQIKKSKTLVKTDITQENRKTLLENNVSIDKQFKEIIEIVNTSTNEIIKVNSFNKINTFKKKLLDNRFISHCLVEEHKKNTLFLTITTNSINSIDTEINDLKELSSKIEKQLKKNKIKYIKVYELTKDLLPHIHFLILDIEIKTKLNKLLSNVNNRTDLKIIKEEDNHKIVNYITKFVEYDNKKLLLGFENKLLENNQKLFTSSKSKIFNKNNRSILFSSFLIHKRYTEQFSKYDSENFLDFCFNYVKVEKNNHNTHLKSVNPHFILKDNKIHHSTQLRVFSQYTRTDKKEKRSIKKTHDTIILFSKLLLKIIIIKKIDYSLLNVINYIFNYIVITTKIRIIIIKPPP